MEELVGKDKGDLFGGDEVDAPRNLVTSPLVGSLGLLFALIEAKAIARFLHSFLSLRNRIISLSRFDIY